MQKIRAIVVDKQTEKKYLSKLLTPNLEDHKLQQIGLYHLLCAYCTVGKYL